MDYCLNCRDCITSLVEEYGEIHVYVEEHESVAGQEPIGLRDSDKYSYGEMAVEISANDRSHYVPYDRIVYIEEANDFPD